MLQDQGRQVSIFSQGEQVLLVQGIEHTLREQEKGGISSLPFDEHRVLVNSHLSTRQQSVTR
jgi:hypothetical protein